MRESNWSSSFAGYVLRSLGIASLLILVSYVSVLLKATDMPLALATWGAIALIYGIWTLGTSAPGDSGVTAVNDMRGQAGINPLANYTNQQEYKLAKLREERPGQHDEIEQDTDSTEEPTRTPSSKEDDARFAACMAIAGLLVLALSWLMGRI